MIIPFIFCASLWIAQDGLAQVFDALSKDSKIIHANEVKGGELGRLTISMYSKTEGGT